MAPTRLASPRPRGGIGRIVLGAAVAAAALLLSGCTEPPKVETFWSPDGKTIAYLAGDGPFGGDALFLYDVKAKTSAKLATGAGAAFSPRWSPDGKVIAFYSASGNEDAMSVPMSVNAVDLATGQMEVLQAQRWPKPVAASPPSAAAPEETVRGLALVFGQPASWSPDGRRLACIGPDPAGTAIVLLSYPSGTAAPIVQTSGTIGWLAWSPDGNKIAYVWFPRPEPEHYWASSLWLHDLATSTTTKIADLEEGSPVEGTSIVWSADSTRIGFIGRGPGHRLTFPEVQGAADIHWAGRETACLVDARPGATVTTAIEDITELAAWAPGLVGVAFAEFNWEADPPEDAVLVYRGLQPPVRKVLGVLPGVRGPSQSSVPEFSADGRRVSVAVGRVLVFAGP